MVHQESRVRDLQEDAMPHNRLHSFKKHLTNRITHRTVRLPGSPFAPIRHVDRRSGKPADEVMTTSLLDRLTSKGHILEFVGESYRFRQRAQMEEQAASQAR